MAENGRYAMKSSPTVELLDVGLAYRRPRHRTSSMKQAVIDTVQRRVQFEDWQALHGVNLTVDSGEVLAVVGNNGAGKSSLLKLLAQILHPTSGRIVVRGSVAPMIELGAGFSNELTGAENVVLYGTLLGRTPREMRARLEPIAFWAGMEDHIDVPLRAYSSGMIARLAFAVATDVSPDLLLIDEVLSVGDAEFRQKSAARTEEMIHSGAAVILVTHDMEAALKLATRGLWLDQGRVAAEGSVVDIVERYVAASAD